MLIALAHPSAAPIAAALFVLGAPLCAQTRTTVLVGPPALGATCYVEHRMPVSPTLLVGGFLWSAPFAGTTPVTGLAVNGLLRVDPASFVLLGVGTTNGAPPLSMAIATPNMPTLLGNQLECQSFDVGPSGVFQLASNDVLLTVASGPPAALNMVPIARGTFQMGSSITPYGPPYYNYAYNLPVHPVTISRPFWIGRHEVTQAQYQAVMGVNPSWFAAAPNAAQRPVETVTWGNAIAYCQALTALEAAAGRLPAGYVYRLPTEAEWEYCCRAGTTTEFHYGATLLCGQSNFFYSYHSNSNCSLPGGIQTMAVGSFVPNAFGLFDMHSNVWEWCQDGWDGSANYPAGSVTDPFVASGPFRVLRGGAFNVSSDGSRSAHRYGLSPTFADAAIGFRVVLAPVVP